MKFAAIPEAKAALMETKESVLIHCNTLDRSLDPMWATGMNEEEFKVKQEKANLI